MSDGRIGNSNQTLQISGVVSAPAYSFASDNNTGLYRIGANNIGVAADGSKVLDIDTAGLTVTGGLAATTAVLGGATGGSQGSGTINATGYYLNGVNIGNSVVYTKIDFTATAGQTTFAVVYSVGYVDVWYNGSKLSTSEYTATNGTSVVLGTPCAAGDIVETVAWTTYTTTNTNIGAGTGTSLALGGATVGSNSLAVTGTTALSGLLTAAGGVSSTAITATCGITVSGGAAATNTWTGPAGAVFL
jgi:hypothetical protein